VGTRKAQVAEAPPALVRIAEVLAEFRGGDPVGWLAAAEQMAETMRGQVTRDWRGHPCLGWVDAERLLLRMRRDQAQAQAEVEERFVEVDAARRAAMPRGIPVGAVPEGVDAGQWMMLSDPERQASRRQSVLEHSLEHPAGAIVYTAVNEGAS
jgi:hypothetical protein